MTDHYISTFSTVPGRQLLGEFSATIDPDGNPQLLDRVMGTVQGLNLQPVQLERIHEAFQQAVVRAMHGGEQLPNSRFCVRIWVLGPCAGDHGWGFFLVEKGDGSQSVGMDCTYLVELFLYQACSS